MRREAVTSTARSDVSSKEYFRSYKDAAKQQWINEIKDAEKWEDGVEPTYKDKPQDKPEKIPGVLANYYKFLFQFQGIQRQPANVIFSHFKKRPITLSIT